MNPMKNIPESLIAELVAGRLVPFVGSGVSRAVDSTFPAWDGLLERMAQRLEQEAKPDEAGTVRYFVKKRRFLDAAAEALKELGKSAFHHVLRYTFDVPQLNRQIPRPTCRCPRPCGRSGRRSSSRPTTTMSCGWANPAAK